MHSSTQNLATGQPATNIALLTSSAHQLTQPNKPAQPGPSILDVQTLMDLQCSGLDELMITRMGIKSFTERAQLKRLLDRDDFESGETGYSIPYLDLDARPTGHFNVRLHKGLRREDSPDKLAKYLKPAGTPNLVYYPPGVAELLAAHDYVIITEGEKKAAKAVQEGFPCVAIGGVWNWMNNAQRAAEKAQGKKASYATRPLTELLDLAEGHKLILLFDSDAAENPQVRRALHTLSDALLFHGAHWVRGVDMSVPDGTDEKVKIGLDDLLMHPDGKTLLEAAIKQDLALPSHSMSPLKIIAYSQDSKGKPLRIIIPNTSTSNRAKASVILKEIEEEDNEGRLHLKVMVIAHTRIWVERVITCTETGETRYEMGFVPLSESMPRYLTGGAELLTLNGRETSYTNHGAQILSKERLALEEFFHICQTTNSVTKVQGSQRRGWVLANQGWSYLTAGGVINSLGRFDDHHPEAPIVPIPTGNADAALAAAMECKGDARVWASAMLTRVLNNPLPALFCGTVVAGLLRHWCPDSENFILHLYGKSSGGKTTVLRACASLIGNPQSLIESWRSTDNALESKLVARNDLVMMLDECSQQRDPSVLEGAAYLIGNGAQKARASREGGERETKKFRVIALSTGEESLFKSAKKGGQEVRTLELPADLNGGLWGEASAHEIEVLARVLSENHGWCLEPLIQDIIDHVDSRDDCFQQIMQSTTQGYRASLKKNAPEIAQRRCKHYALITTGLWLLLQAVLKLAGERDIKGETDKRLTEHRAYVAQHLLVLPTDQFAVSENDTLLAAFAEALSVHSNRIHKDGEDKPYGDIWGFEHQDKIALFPSLLAELVKPHDPTRMRQTLREAGVLEERKSVRHDGKAQKCHLIDLAVLNKKLGGEK